LGSFLLTDPVDFTDDRTKGFIGFQDLNQTLDVITDVLDESDAAFSTYNMKTNLGPISDSIANGTGTFSVPTTGGTLTFTTNSTNASFQAVTASSAPEPGSLGLLLMGALGLHALRSRIVRRGYDLHKSGSYRDCAVADSVGAASGRGARRR
jgi:hypothetical protein